MKKRHLLLAGFMMMASAPAFSAGLVPLITPIGAHMWIDPALTAATLLDAHATKKQNKKAVNAKDAIKKLEKALNGGQCGGSTGGKDTSGDDSLAAVYTPDMIQSKIGVSSDPKEVFDATRQAISEFLFETSATDIKGDCDLDDRSCATQRQNEWLLASVTLASATADKVLDQTAKEDVKDGQTEAEKPTDETGDTQTTGGGKTSLQAHFEQLANNFNAQTTPMGLYNRMADIVLDTHRQTNDANALLGRDLEASGLRIINETGPQLLTGPETEE